MNNFIDNYFCLVTSFVGGFGLMLTLYSYYNRDTVTTIITFFASIVITYTSVKDLKRLIEK
jgi:hypothetical protein